MEEKLLLSILRFKIWVLQITLTKDRLAREKMEFRYVPTCM